jgi:hypothetical protein|tara:strand:+ start:264 stop:659 length:396 start_codon:yes stop_codon:yes gene_type:complete
MDLEKIFKNLIIANAVTIVILIIASFSMPKDLMEIAEYVPAGIYGSESGLVLTLLIVIAYIISLILLYRYVSYGKNVYVAVVVIGFILDLAGEAYIMTSISFSIGVILNMITGAILTLLFFSPIKDKFVQK